MTAMDTAPRLVIHIGEAPDRYGRCGLCGTPNFSTGPGTNTADGDIRMVAPATNDEHGQPGQRICNTCADTHWPGVLFATAALDHFAAALLAAPTKAHRALYREAVSGQIDVVMRMIGDSDPITDSEHKAGDPTCITVGFNPDELVVDLRIQQPDDTTLHFDGDTAHRLGVSLIDAARQLAAYGEDD